MTLKDILLDETEKVYTVTKNLFNLVSNNELQWIPASGKNWMTVEQLLKHCASFGCGKAVQGFVKGDWGLPEGSNMEELNEEDHVPSQAALPSVENVEEAILLLEEDRRLTISCISDVDESDLLNKTSTAPWGGAELTLFQHLLLMIAHLNQHKGQLFYYLKLMGKNVNSKDLWGE
jgi:DinB superfamily